MGYSLSATLCIGATFYDENSDKVINENFESEEYEDSVIEYLEDNKDEDMTIEVSGSDGSVAYTLAIADSVTCADWSGQVVALDKYTDKKIASDIERLKRCLTDHDIEYTSIGLQLLPLYW